MDWMTLWAPSLTIVAGVVYAVRLEGRLNVHDEKFKGTEVKFGHQEVVASLRDRDIISRLDRIERKQDVASITPSPIVRPTTP